MPAKDVTVTGGYTINKYTLTYTVDGTVYKTSELEYVFSALQGVPGIESVSGLGLMIGIKTVKPAKEVVTACMERGVLCLTAKDKVRLLPALNIPMETLKKAIAVLKSVCSEGL